jgi:predicted AAA+ superfamily ATPase
VKRDLYQTLLDWKASARRKPLLLKGARQTGKTHLLRELADREYEQALYIDFEADPEAAGFFERDLDPHRVIRELGVYKGVRLRPERDILVLDEIQVSNRALLSLKYFLEDAPEYHVAAAGSLLGIKTSVPGSFPVGKVSFLDLRPLTFMEFLDAREAAQYRQLLESTESSTPLSEPLHKELLALMREYYFAGGMPEVVDHHCRGGDVEGTRQIQRGIIDSYVLDFAKHAPGPDVPKLTRIWGSIPRQLARENKKFKYTDVKKGARARQYEAALTWLEDAGLIHLCRAVSRAAIPLAHYADESCFKVYPLDVGLLGAMAATPLDVLVRGERLFNEYEGAFVESYVAQQLVRGGGALHYWRSRGGRAELDFLLERDARVVPLEVKAGINPRGKSLRSFDQQFAPPVLARANLLNLKHDGKVLNVPLYAVSELGRLIEAHP